MYEAFEAEKYTEVQKVRKRLDKTTGIETQNINWKNTNPEAITLDELTGEIIKLHNDAISEEQN